jgi:ribonuclease HI
MVHVVTDGGARPNPGSAGRGAVIGQNWKCTLNFGHYDRASNNAIEILAVVEAFRVLPETMHVWVSTDSAYVKKRITELLPNWVRNGWRNSKKAAVANKTLWQKLFEMVGRHRMVEWSWVKDHSRILLNECADMLATKGVENEPSQGLVQYVVPVGEDTDSREYVLNDGEETTMDEWRGETKLERTYVMRDGDNLFDYLASAPPSDASDDSDSDIVPEVVPEEVANVLLEDNDTPPQPRSDSDDDSRV